MPPIIEEPQGNGLPKFVMPIVASLLVAAIIALGGFTMQTSQNVAVLSEGIRNLNTRIVETQARIEILETRIRLNEQNIIRIQADHSK